jgi:hypothetical protein
MSWCPSDIIDTTKPKRRAKQYPRRNSRLHWTRVPISYTRVVDTIGCARIWHQSQAKTAPNPDLKKRLLITITHGYWEIEKLAASLTSPLPLYTDAWGYG